jgi:hypothetical protein
MEGKREDRGRVSETAGKEEMGIIGVMKKSEEFWKEKRSRIAGTAINDS